MAYKINFSIPEEDKQVYEKLMSMQRNKSRYIVDLIKKDLGILEVSSSPLIDEDRLNELIEKKVKEFYISQEMEKEKFKDIRTAIEMNDDEDFM